MLVTNFYHHQSTLLFVQYRSHLVLLLLHLVLGKEKSAFLLKCQSAKIHHQECHNHKKRDQIQIFVKRQQFIITDCYCYRHRGQHDIICHHVVYIHHYVVPQMNFKYDDQEDYVSEVDIIILLQ